MAARDRARRPLSRARVMESATALADEEGLAAVTMRVLAERLGVEAMSLYNHVANKDDLLAGMVTLVVEDFALAAPTVHDWVATVRTSAISAHRHLVDHPWACQLIVTRTHVVGAALTDYMEALLAALSTAGFSGETADRAYHAIMGHVFGYTLQELGLPLDDRAARQAGEAFRRALSADGHPHLLAHLTFHLERDRDAGDDSGGFVFTLDLLLDGLERLRGT